MKMTDKRAHEYMAAGMRLMKRLPRSRNRRVYLLIREMGEIMFETGLGVVDPEFLAEVKRLT